MQGLVRLDVLAVRHHIVSDDDYTVDHMLERSTHPHLTWDETNWRPAHGRKHPEFRCPDNFGRSGRKASRWTTWTADGW